MQGTCYAMQLNGNHRKEKGVHMKVSEIAWGSFRCLFGGSWGPPGGLLGAFGSLWWFLGMLLGPRARKVRSDPASGPLLGAVLGFSWAIFEAS